MRIVAAVVISCLLAFSAFAQPTGRLQSGLFDIRYNPSDEAVAQDSATILHEALSEFPPELAPGDDPIQVIIASTYDEFRVRAGAYGKAHVAGIAQGDRGVIVIKAPHLLPPESEYAAVLRHELAHVLMARNTNSAYVPRWFDEGVAMIVSRELRWSTWMSLARMYLGGDVIPYRMLEFSFAPMGDEVRFGEAYAQALSMTRYLKEEVGDEAFWRIVHALKHQDFDDALKAETGLTPRAFYEGWKSTLWKVATVATLVSGFGAFQLMAILVIVAYWLKHKRGQEIVREWEEEGLGDGLASDETEDDFPWTEIDDEEDRW